MSQVTAGSQLEPGLRPLGASHVNAEHREQPKCCCCSALPSTGACFPQKNGSLCLEMPLHPQGLGGMARGGQITPQCHTSRRTQLPGVGLGQSQAFPSLLHIQHTQSSLWHSNTTGESPESQGKCPTSLEPCSACSG